MVEGKLVQDGGVETSELDLVEAGGCPAEVGEVERLDQGAALGDGLDRLGGAEPRQQRDAGIENLPSVPTSNASCANRGGCAPSAVNIWICTAVLETWSSPRSTSLTPISMSSTALGSM